MHMIACHTWHSHDAQVQQSGVLGAGASEERGETARMVNPERKDDTLRLCLGTSCMQQEHKCYAGVDSYVIMAANCRRPSWEPWPLQT